MDYFDILLAKKLSGGGGGEITVEGLNVEDNGTYTAPSGKAYSPVVVNVPLGEKAITANGEYNASADDLKGYSKVTVNVAGFKVKDMPTGAISSFADGTDNPLKELKVSIVPVQSGSGDPSPTNPRPISGWTGADVTVCGINLWNEEWEGGAYNNTTGGLQPNASCIRSKTKIKVNPNTSYYMQIGSTTALNICQYDKNGSYLGSSTLIQCSASKIITTAATCEYLAFYCLGTTYNNDISLNSISTDTTYHPYNGTTTTISLGQEVFGGELDVTNGIIKEEWENVVFDGTESIALSPYHFFILPLPKRHTTIMTQDVKLCSILKVSNDTADLPRLSTGNTEYQYWVWVASDSPLYDNLQAFKDWLAQMYNNGTPLQICYKTNTEPIEETITPTQVSSILGTNNIWADCGDVISGEYFTEL